MSVDTIALLESRDPKSALERFLRDVAPQMPDELCRVGEIFADWWRPKVWEFSDTTLYGPGGWALRPRERTIEIYHVLRFGAIAVHDGGPCVLEAINYLGRIFDSAQAIFTHELLPLPDLPLEEGANELKETWEQAPTWESLWRAELFERHCWILVNLPIEPRSARVAESRQNA